MNKQKAPIYDEHQLRINATEPQFHNAYKRQRTEACDLLNRFSNKENILLLADDVGLGKTWVAMITLFSLLVERKTPAADHALILVPTRLLAKKWYNELLTFQRNYVKDGGKKFAIELTTSSEDLIKRLGMLESYKTRNKTLSKILEPDKSSLAFMAFCLNEYLNAEGIAETKSNEKSAKVLSKEDNTEESDKAKDNGKPDEALVKKETEYTKIRKWTRGVLKQEEALLLHRFFTQYEVVRWVRFLRRYAPEVGYNQWLNDHAQPEKIVKALERTKAGRQYNFIKSINDALDLNNNKVSWAVQKKLYPIGRHFVRLASETMPFLEVYKPNSKESWQQIIDNENYSKTIDLLEELEKNDQDAKKAFCWIIQSTQELIERKIHTAAASLALDKLKSIITNEISSFKKKEDLRPQELILFISNFISYVNSHNNSKDRGSLFEKSPWIYSDWNKKKQTTCDDFVINLVEELRLTDRTRNITAERIGVIKLFLNCAKSLYKHLINPSVGITYNFWDREKIVHNIFIMYMNDLKQWGSIGDNPEKELKKLKKPFQLVVVDEAHNWTSNNKRGNKEYAEYFRDLTRKTLLMTATPLQLSYTNLQSIFDAVQDKDSWEKNSAYSKLFTDENDYALSKVIDKQNAVLGAWKNLGHCGKKLEDLSASISELPEKKLKKKQLAIWRSLQQDNESQIRTMANAVCDLRDFLDQMTESLSKLVIKNKSTKNRDFHCGKDALNSQDVSKTQVTNNRKSKLHFYPVEGIPNSASLFNFICMRLSSRGFNSDNTLINESPKLMLGLPSSYQAMLSSKIRNSVSTSEKDDYFQIYEQLIEKGNKDFSLDLKHPKVNAVLKIICDNLLHRGEKTLVFCERRETVNVLEKLLIKRIQDFSNPFTSKYDLNKIFNLITKIQKENELSVTNELKDLIQKLANKFKMAAFGRVVKVQDHQAKEQAQYDARHYLSIWIIYDWIKTSFNNLKGPKDTKITNALNDALYNLCQDIDNNDLDDVRNYGVVTSLTGNTSKNRPDTLRSFSSFGLPLVLICTPVSQEGVDMHKYCRQIILHDLNWNPAKLEQRIGRVDRQGSLASAKNVPVEIYVPFLSNSYDDYQYNRVLERANIQELLFGQNDLVVTELTEDDEDPKDKIEFEDKSKTYDLPNINGLIRGFFDVDLSTPKCPF